MRALLRDQRIRFLLVGGFNTVLGFGLYWLLLVALGDRPFAYLISLAVSWAISITVAFVLYRTFVFIVRGNVLFDYVRFLSVYAVSIVLNAVGLTALVQVLQVDPLAAQAVMIVVTTVLSYVGHRWFSFRRPALSTDAVVEPSAEPAAEPDSAPREPRAERADGAEDTRSVLSGREGGALIALLALVTIAPLAIIVGSLDRGFDWWDEGFVYAMITTGRVAVGEVWGFQHLLNPLWDLTGGSVLVFRVLRVLGYVALGVVLTVMARAVLRARGVELSAAGWVMVGLAAQVGTLAAWSYPPRYLGYNELSSWLTQLIAALLILLLLARPHDRPAARRLALSLWALSGLLVALLVVAKITSGALLALVALAAALVATDAIPRWQRSAAGLLGAGIGVLAMIVSGVPVVSYLDSVIQIGLGLSPQAGTGYSASALLVAYGESIVVTAAILAVPLLLASLVVIVSRGVGRVSASPRSLTVPVERITAVFAGVLLLLLVDLVLFGASPDSWTALGSLSVFLLALAVLCMLVLRDRTAQGQPPSGGPAMAATVPGGPGMPATVPGGPGMSATVGAGALFVLAPLLSAVGTNNPLAGQTLFAVTIWAVGAGVGLMLLAQRSTAVTRAARLLPSALLIGVVAVWGLAVASDAILHPYRTAPLFSQQSRVDDGPLRGISLTPGEAGLFLSLGEAAERLDATEAPTLSIARPGALLAFNASTWTAMWPGPDWAASIALSCSEAEPDGMIVLQSADQVEGVAEHDRLVAGLRACGIDFPAAFEVVDRLPSDDPQLDVTIWRLP